MSDLNFSLANGSKPMIREAANMNNDGGGGNLGYMRRRRKDKRNRKQMMSESIFGKRQDDIISVGKDIEFVEEEGLVSDFVGKIFNKIKQTVGL